MVFKKIKSLKSRLLVWAIIPTTLLTIADSWLIYKQSSEGAAIVEDKLLRASARVISQQVRLEGTHYEIIIPPAALEMLADEYKDWVYFSVRDKSDHFIAGNYDLPPSLNIDPTNNYDFYFSSINSEPVRVVSYLYQIPNSENDFIVTNVARTLRYYNVLRDDFYWTRMRRHLVFLTILVASLSLALLWTLRPINNLANRLQQRDPKDLAPLEVLDAPRELWPVIRSINSYIERLRNNLVAYEDFLSHSAHHLRTSYAILNAEVDIEQRTQPPGSASSRFLSRFKHHVSAGTRTVNDLLMLANLHNAREGGIFHNKKKEVVSLVNLVTRIMEELAPVAFQKNISFEVEELDPDQTLFENTSLITELISNLIGNSIQHIPNGSTILIGVFAEAGSPVLRITDNGPGIPETERENVFRRFYRLDDSKTNSSGLGLSIVQEICELIEAKITLSSPEQGNGLQVSVRFKSNQSKQLMAQAQ
jgi:two-component system sensor histidine kinase TctE